MPFNHTISFVPKVMVAELAGIILTTALLTIGCGKSSTSPFKTPPPKATFAYTANSNSGNISGYTVDPSSGVLTPLAAFPIASGVNPVFITHDPLGRFAIVADIASDLLRVYEINSSTGMLTEVQPSPYAVEQEPRALAIDPTGSFVYVASQALNNVTAFSIDAHGVLTPVPGSPFPTTGAGPSFGCCVVVDPSGKFLYVEDTANVYAFAINASTGALTLTTTVSGPRQGTGLAVDPAGKFLYAVGAGSNSVQSFAINSATGAITLSSTSPLALQDGAFTISVDPSGTFAYTVEAAATLIPYGVQNGVLTSLSSSYPGALGSLQLAIDPSGSFLYAPQTGTVNSVSGFRISASGTLSALPGSPTPSGQWPFSITITNQ